MVSILVILCGFVSTVCGGKLQCFIDLVFLLDSSDSVTRTNFDKELAFLKGLAHAFPIGAKNVQIGVVTFATHTPRQFNLNTHLSESSIISAVNRIPYHAGGTDTAGGLDYVRQNSFTSNAGDRAEAPNILIVLTDGLSDDNALTVAAANRFNKYTKILAIGVGSAVRSELIQIAGSSSRVYMLANFNDLQNITQEIQSAVCQRIERVDFTLPYGNGLSNGTTGGSSSKNSTGEVPMVNQGGVWAEICGDGVDITDSTVICHTLGYGHCLHYNKSSYLAEYSNSVDVDSVNVITDSIECTGNEARIILCPLKQQPVTTSCKKRVVINCVPTLNEAIKSRCTSTNWDITIDTDVLSIIYPGSIPTNIYLGEGCTGTLEDAYRLVFKDALNTCGTKTSYTDSNKVYSNQLSYVFRDPNNPLIIRNYNWTIGTTCLHRRDQTAHTQIVYNQTHVSTGNISSSVQYKLTTGFYSDPYFSKEISGNPLQIPVGNDVYIRVSLNSSDWSISMRLNTCYTHTTADTSSPKYYLIKDGCEVDGNTHIISAAAHDTKFVFRMIQMGTNNDDVYVHCDAKMCTTSQDCSHRCN